MLCCPFIHSDTLIKDIPFGVWTKVENMMTPDEFSNHNWKGLAGAMGMSADDVRQLEGERRGKMAGLFDRMMHTKRTVKDLLEFLKHPEVQRLDVIEEIVHGCKLPEELLVPTESCEYEISSWICLSLLYPCFCSVAGRDVIAA